MNAILKQTYMNANTLTETLTASDTTKMAWVPWAMRGAHFKLLNVDRVTGQYTLLIKVAADVTAPLHRHIGTVEVYILEGSFYYLDAPDIKFEAGCYLHEKEGAIHQPASSEGAVMLSVFNGPIESIDANGKVLGQVDWAWHVNAWNAATSSAA